MFLQKIKSRESGILLYGITPPKAETSVDKLSSIAERSLHTLCGLDIDALVACGISVPLGYFAMNTWLETYDYRTELSVWVLLLTCVGALAVTLITVGIQALKAAMANPVKSLRSE